MAIHRLKQKPLNSVFLGSLSQTGRTHLGDPARVLGEDVAGAAREGVGVLLAEDVAHAAARDDLQGAAALPHPERDL